MAKVIARKKPKKVLPIRTRRDIQGDASSTVERSVHCPAQKKSVDIAECANCAHLDTLSADGDGYLVCTPPERGDVAPRLHRDVTSIGVEAALTPISQVMRPQVVCAREDTSVETLVELFVDGTVNAVPIIDTSGRPIGLVSKTDVLRDQHDRGDVDEMMTPSERGRAGRPDAGFHVVTLAAATASDVMTPIALWLEETASLSHAASLMAKQGVHQVIVLAPEKRTVVGLLTADDVVRWVADISGEPVAARAV